MEKHRPAQYEAFTRSSLNGADYMLIYVIFVVARVLLKAETTLEFRNDLPDDVLEPQQYVGAVFTAEKLIKFFPYALGGYICKTAMKFQHSGGGVFLDAEPELRCEPHGSEDTESVLRKALFRVADTAYQLSRNIFFSTERVNDIPRNVHCHGVYGEIAP